MPTLYVMRGLPGAGKTTFAKELMTRFSKEDPSKKYIRVSRDSLREMCHFGEYSSENEEAITLIKRTTIDRLLFEGYNVISDDTNLDSREIESLQTIAQLWNAEVIVYDIDTLLDDCIKQDAGRDRPVGEPAIRRMYDKYLALAKVPSALPPISPPPASEENANRFVFVRISAGAAKLLKRVAKEQRIDEIEAHNEAIAELAYFLEKRGEGWNVLLQRPGDVREVKFKGFKPIHKEAE